MVLSYNPGYTGGRDGRIEVRGQPRQKAIVRPHLSKQFGHSGAHL
jgi:hypothetical protein